MAFAQHTNFPLPNLTEFHLYLPEGAGPFSMSALFQFLSDSPLLEKLYVRIASKTTEYSLGPGHLAGVIGGIRIRLQFG